MNSVRGMPARFSAFLAPWGYPQQLQMPPTGPKSSGIQKPLPLLAVAA
jgi:hypothetical protein